MEKITNPKKIPEKSKKTFPKIWFRTPATVGVKNNLYNFSIFKS
jgi:hypothetical protein